MNCGVGLRQGLDPVLLWLWLWLAAAAPIQPLAWELLYAVGAALPQKKSTNIKFWRGCGEKGALLHCWWEYRLVQPLWRAVWRFFEKLNMELPYDPAIPLLGIYPEKTII